MKKTFVIIALFLLIISCNKEKQPNITIDKFSNINETLKSGELSKDSVSSLLKKAIDYYKTNNNYDRIASIYKTLLLNDRYAKIYTDSVYSFALKMKAMKNDSIAVKLLSLILDNNPYYDMKKQYRYVVNYYMNSQNKLYATKIIKEILPVVKSKKLKIQLYKDIIDIYDDLDINMLAFEYCKKAIEDVGEDPDILYRLGDVSYKIAIKKYETKDYSAALFYVNKTISAGLPESIQDNAYLLKGEIYFDEGLYKKATHAFKKVLELNPYRQGQTVKIAQKYINEIEDKEL
ncbi:hypothetical protein DRP44_07985 [candidate division TA06 bacterium]|uniref:Tetratricopeptide repeat protein n=1 Tax=candidate division TA06 bacterium TaxID=2250710 RepID=A0A660S6X6_UNCT6|nr:MAG: hypothetical protein DRP44_07985 [candidate division TA06 bacterium]